MSINIVVPMAGAGSRFTKAGYKNPKPFIDVLGQSMISRVLDNINIRDARYILIARKEHVDAEPETVQRILDSYNAEFITIDQLTEGAACTVLYAHRLIDTDVPLMIANSDQIVDVSLQSYVDEAFERNLDGSILTFRDNHPKWSYAKLNDGDLVTEVREKEVISEFATVGIYLFTKGKTFVNSAIDMMVRNNRVNNEFYVCPVYNYAIKSGAGIGIYNIDSTQMHGTGTPEDLDRYVDILKSRVTA